MAQYRAPLRGSLCLGAADDPISALALGLFRNEVQAKLLAHHACEEAAHGMLLPAGDVHDFRDRRALGPAEQGDDRSLLGIRFRTAARLRRSLGFFPRLARLAGSTP